MLNDHWDTMRAWGFVSNRIFDVLACGTPVISDHLPEIEELFDGAVADLLVSRRPRRTRPSSARRTRRPRARSQRAGAPSCSHSTPSTTERASSCRSSTSTGWRTESGQLLERSSVRSNPGGNSTRLARSVSSRVLYRLSRAARRAIRESLSVVQWFGRFVPVGTGKRNGGTHNR